MDSAEPTAAETAITFELPHVLVVGTELTVLDQRLATIAIQLAIAMDAAVRLVHAIDAPEGNAEGAPDEVQRHTRRERKRVAVADELLEAERMRLASLDRDGHAVVRVTLAEGPARESLVGVARELRRAWIVVGAGAAPTLPGRTADHVLRHTAVPVLVVPLVSTGALAGPVVVAVEADPSAAHLLRAAGEVARALGRSLEVVHVHPATDEDAAARMADRLSEVPTNAATARTLRLIVQRTSVAQAITEHVGADTSILIVGAGGRRDGQRQLGSTAASLGHTSPVPLLVVH